MKFWGLITFLVFWSTTGQSFDLEGYYGRQVIQNNSLFQSDDGQGTEHGGRILLYPGAQEFFGLGAYYSKVHYDLQSSHELEGIAIDGKGEFNGDYYGPCVQLTAPIPYLTFYSGFSYVMGSYRYYLSKTSSLTSAAGDDLTAKMRSEVHLDTLGLSTFFGIKTRGTYSFFFELGQSFQTLTITSIAANVANYVNGSAQSQDSQEAPYEESFDSLIDQSFNFSGRSMLGGFEISL
jgi:hypothetical protein